MTSSIITEVRPCPKCSGDDLDICYFNEPKYSNFIDAVCQTCGHTTDILDELAAIYDGSAYFIMYY